MSGARIAYHAAAVQNSTDQVALLERRNAELAAAIEQLQAREERWRTIVSTDPECVKTVSPEGYLIEMNPAGLAMLSATSLDQVKARPLLEWIAPEHRDAFRELHQRVMAGETGELEFEVIGTTGVRRWLRTTAAPLRDRNGRITSVLGISRDITGQRELEAQLRHSQKMEAIGQLAGGIAHDFNNILTIIQGFALTLLEGEQDPAARRTATQHIVEASERAAGLTRQLLAFGRRQIMQPQHVDLNELVTSLAKMVRRVLGEDIDLQLQLSARPLGIHADPGLIDQVLMNLVINARDAMPSGGCSASKPPRGPRPRAPRSWFAWWTTARGFPPRPCRESSTRSTPPRKQVKDPGSDWRLRSASSPNTPAASTSPARSVTARRSKSCCPRPRTRRGRCCHTRSPSRRVAAAKPSCSSKTNRQSGC